MGGLNEVAGGGGKPGGLKRDQLFIQQQEGDNNKILGLWSGDKSDTQKVILNLAVQFPGDGNDYEMEATDKLAGADTTSSTATITLPDVSEIEDGHEVIIEDHGGNAGTNNITVDTPGSESVETSTISTNDGHVRLLWDAENTNWKDVT